MTIQTTKQETTEDDLHRLGRDGRKKPLKQKPPLRADPYADRQIVDEGGETYFYLVQRDALPPMFINVKICPDGFTVAKQIQRHIGSAVHQVNGEPRQHQLLGMSRLDLLLSRRQGYYNVFVDPAPSGA